MMSNAALSACRTYRYDLCRGWGDPKRMVAFIGLNPSTADETKEDPTIRRCIGFAKAWGYGGIHMLNLFAFRATDPKAMKTADDPVGPLNDYYIMGVHMLCEKTVAAWGSHGGYMDRSAAVRKLIPELYCLKTNRDGQPAHPLYLKKDLKPVGFAGVSK